MLDDLKLQWPDRSEDRRLVADVGFAQHLHHTLLVELADTGTKLFRLRRVERASDTEVCRRERRHERPLDLVVDIDRVADPEVVGVHEADDITGERLLDRLALLTGDGVCVLGRERLAGGLVGHDHAAIELARADPQEGNAITMRLVHVRLDLEHDAGERSVERPRIALAVDAGRRRRHQIDHRVENHADAEVRERRAEEHR